jgi:hypothetical protein
LDIVCDDEKQFQSWIITLNFLKREANMRYEEDPIRLVILKQWIKADVNNDGHLDFGEIKNLCHTLNMEIDDRTLKEKFAEFDADRRYYCFLITNNQWYH